jgi:hypothetical protein
MSFVLFSALDAKGNFKQSKDLSINKIGHGEFQQTFTLDPSTWRFAQQANFRSMLDLEACVCVCEGEGSSTVSHWEITPLQYFTSGEKFLNGVFFGVGVKKISAFK